MKTLSTQEKILFQEKNIPTHNLELYRQEQNRKDRLGELAKSLQIFEPLVTEELPTSMQHLFAILVFPQYAQPSTA